MVLAEVSLSHSVGKKKCFCFIKKATKSQAKPHFENAKYQKCVNGAQPPLPHAMSKRLTFVFPKGMLNYQVYVYSNDMDGWMTGWMDDLRLYILLNSVLVISRFDRWQ